MRIAWAAQDDRGFFRALVILSSEKIFYEDIMGNAFRIEFKCAHITGHIDTKKLSFEIWEPCLAGRINQYRERAIKHRYKIVPNETLLTVAGMSSLEQLIVWRILST